MDKSNDMKLNKILAIVIYTLGCLCVAYFAMLALIGGRNIANPDAMLPYTDFDRGTMILALGCIPMVISCIAIIKSFKIEKRIKRILVMIPGFITVIPFVVYAVFFIIFMFLGMLDATGLR